MGKQKNIKESTIESIRSIIKNNGGAEKFSIRSLQQSTEFKTLIRSHKLNSYERAQMNNIVNAIYKGLSNDEIRFITNDDIPDTLKSEIKELEERNGKHSKGENTMKKNNEEYIYKPLDFAEKTTESEESASMSMEDKDFSSIIKKLKTIGMGEEELIGFIKYALNKAFSINLSDENIESLLEFIGKIKSNEEDISEYFKSLFLEYILSKKENVTDMKNDHISEDDNKSVEDTDHSDKTEVNKEVNDTKKSEDAKDSSDKVEVIKGTNETKKNEEENKPKTFFNSIYAREFQRIDRNIKILKSAVSE